ncbi:MAG: nuclear transport factor 2 family protein [Gemmatimonadetes bacterium]|nr:nuclear transport factor 2 family protein [Gemmatimonadota bacterium]
MSLRSFVPLVLLASGAGCASSTREAIADPAREIRTAFDSLVAAVVRLDVPATLAAYDTSAAFLHTSDGAVVRSGAANRRRVETMFPGLRAVRDAVIDSTHVNLLNADAGVLVASFRETLVDTSGTALPIRGVWTTVFQRQPTGWKVISEHVSHLPQ